MKFGRVEELLISFSCTADQESSFQREYNDVRKEVWETRLQEVVEFERKNGRWSSKAAGAGEEELRLT